MGVQFVAGFIHVWSFSTHKNHFNKTSPHTNTLEREHLLAILRSYDFILKPEKIQTIYFKLRWKNETARKDRRCTLERQIGICLELYRICETLFLIQKNETLFDTFKSSLRLKTKGRGAFWPSVLWQDNTLMALWKHQALTTLPSSALGKEPVPHELFFPSLKASSSQQQAFSSLFWQFWTERVPKCRNRFPHLERQSMSLFHHAFLWWFLVFMQMMSSPESSWTGLRLAQSWAASSRPCPGQTCSQGLWVDPFQGRCRHRGDMLQQPRMNDSKNCHLFSGSLLPRSRVLWPNAPRQPQERMPAHGHLWPVTQEMLCQPCALPVRILAVPRLISTLPDVSYLFIPLGKSVPLCWAMPACWHNSPASPRSF